MYKKIIFSILFYLLALTGFSQNGGIPTFASSSMLLKGYLFMNRAGITQPNSFKVFEGDSLRFDFRVKKFYFDSLMKVQDGRPTNIFWQKSDTTLGRSSIDSIFIKASQITGLPLDTVYNTGTALNRSSSGTNVFFGVDMNQVMSVSRATDSINSINLLIGKKADTSSLSNYLLSSIAASTYQTSLGFTPYNSTNPSGYISSVPAQTFASLTSKPTILVGYGITDAYPLSGNPSAFLTSVPAQSWTSITGKPSFASVATSGDYTDLINKPSFQSPLSGTGFVKISGSTISYDNSTYLTGNQTVTLSGDATGSGATSITTTLATVNSNVGTFSGSYTVNGKGLITAANNPIIDTMSTSRSFNFGYQMSTTKWIEIKPCFKLACSLSLSGGQEGNIFLETSPDNATWTTIGSFNSSNTGSLTIGLNTVQSSSGQLTVLLAPTYYYRLRTVNVTGTPTFTMLAGNKTTY